MFINNQSHIQLEKHKVKIPLSSFGQSPSFIAPVLQLKLPVLFLHLAKKYTLCFLFTEH